MLAGKIGFFRASVSAPVTLDPDAAAYIAAVEAADGQALESAVRTAINGFVVGCKADGNWINLGSWACCILMGARTLAGALVPLKGVGSAPTNFNFVSGDYNRKTGLAGNGTTKYLVFSVAADKGAACHQAVWVTAAPTVSNAAYLGNGNASAGSTLIRTGGSGSVLTYSRSATGSVVGSSTATGFIGHARSTTSQYTARCGGATSVLSVAASTPASGNYHVFKTNSPTLPAYSDCRMAFYSFAPQSVTSLTLFESRVAALYAAIGAAIP